LTNWYNPNLPVIFILGGVFLGYVSFLLGGSAYTSLAIVYFATLAFGPESSYDRILAAFLPAMFIMLHCRAFTTTMIVILSIIGLRVPFETRDIEGQLLLWIPPLGTFLMLILENVKLRNYDCLWKHGRFLEDKTYVIHPRE